jgi:hypothetical protein
VKPILDKYSQHLKAGGVFIVRLYAGDSRPGNIKRRVVRKMDLINREFDVVESRRFETPALPTVMVFRPKHRS